VARISGFQIRVSQRLQLGDADNTAPVGSGGRVVAAHACVSAIGHYLGGFATDSKMMRVPSLDLTTLTRG
jgi:hypothetical protein